MKKRIRLLSLAVIITSIIGIVSGCGSKETDKAASKSVIADEKTLGLDGTQKVQSPKSNENDATVTYGANGNGAKGKTAVNNVIKITEKALKEEREALTIDIKIPVISGIADKVIEDKLNKIFENDIMSKEASIEKSAADALESSKDGSFPFHKYSIQTTYEERYSKNGILSLTVLYSQYTGGAHSFEVQNAYNFDLTTGKLLKLQDLFQRDFNYSAFLSKEVLNQMKAHPQNYLSDAALSFKQIGNDRPFCIEDGNLVIYYNEYEIAPYAAGIPEFKIPFSILDFSDQFKFY